MKKNLLIAAALTGLSVSGGLQAAETQKGTTRPLPLPGYAMEELTVIDQADAEGGHRFDHARLIPPGEVTFPGAAAADQIGGLKPHTRAPFNPNDPALVASIKEKLDARHAKPLTSEEKVDAGMMTGLSALAIFAGICAFLGSAALGGPVAGVILVAAGAYFAKDAYDRYTGKTRIGS